jgi:lipoprotein Spr
MNGVRSDGFFPLAWQEPTPVKQTWRIESLFERKKKKSKLTPTPSVTESNPSPTYGSSLQNNTSLLTTRYSFLMGTSSFSPEQLSLLDEINRWWGTPYRLGMNIPQKGTDCSGFMQELFTKVYHIKLPRTADQQYQLVHPIPLSTIQVGDLLFFTQTPHATHVTHVGVYMGNNRFAQASTSQGVTITPLQDAYWSRHLKSAGRIK